jgi:hypothetical protein
MLVEDLIRYLKMADPKATVEFHDVSTGRECPINSAFERTRPEAPIKKRVVLSNKLS